MFGAIASARRSLALRARPPRLLRIIQDTLHTTGQAAVRLSIFLLAAARVRSQPDAGFEFVLGAFAAGLIVGLVLDSPRARSCAMRLEGIGFGFLIPIYFVVDRDERSTSTASSRGAGSRWRRSSSRCSSSSRGASALLWLRELGPRGTASLALFGATALPLIVAIVGIGTERGAIARQRRRVADRRRDDLGARLPVGRDAVRCARTQPRVGRSSRSTRPGSTSRRDRARERMST